MITAREYISANALDMPRNAAAIHARLMKPKNAFKPVVLAISAPVEPVKAAPKTKKPLVRPYWSRMAITFDHHVRRHNAHLRIVEIMALSERDAAAEIEVFAMSKRSVAEIVEDVLADYPQFTLEDIKGPRRTVPLIKVRHLAIYEVRQQRPDLSYPVIGRWFGGRDHTTILSAVKKIAAMRAGA